MTLSRLSELEECVVWESINYLWKPQGAKRRLGQVYLDILVTN